MLRAQVESGKEREKSARMSFVVDIERGRRGKGKKEREEEEEEEVEEEYEPGK
jgi:hypothetical protein